MFYVTETDANCRRNTKSPHPMPALIISPSATSSRTIISPPPGAFQPAMRILKRPSNSNSPTTPSAATPSETIKEREAKYQAARERIFGEEDGTSYSSSQSAQESKSPAPAQDKSIVSIVRNPRGPGDYGIDDGTGQNTARGFGRHPEGVKSPPAASQESLEPALDATSFSV